MREGWGEAAGLAGQLLQQRKQRLDSGAAPEPANAADHSHGEHPEPLAAAEQGVSAAKRRRRRRSPPPPRTAGLPGLAGLQASAAARAVQPGRSGVGRAGRARACASLLPEAAGIAADGRRCTPARCQQHGGPAGRRRAELGFASRAWEAQGLRRG